MIILAQGDEKAFKILYKKNLEKDAEYKVSQFVYPFYRDGRYLLRNTLTRGTAELNADEWKAFEQIRAHGADLSFIESSGLTELAHSRYFIENDCDDIRNYQTVVFLLKTMDKAKPGLKSYTILPTTACNARCVYCYEEGYEIKTMTPEITDRLIDFICETRHDDKITLRWFGGEPTVCADKISYICRELEKRNVPFRSTMITNGSLVTKELAHEMKEVWKLDKVQVSLDGARQDYELRKRYITPKLHNYDVVMQAIGYMADEGISLDLRFNFDRENYDRLKDFIDEMKERFGKYSNVSLYPSVLYQERQKDISPELFKLEFELKDYISKAGLINTTRTSPKFRLNCCMADRLDKSIVISPEGKFFNCEHMPENNTWGNIFDGITDQKRFEELSAPAEIDERCKGCTFLPICTPFYMHGCVGHFNKCSEFRCMQTEHSLQAFINGGQDFEPDDNKE